MTSGFSWDSTTLLSSSNLNKHVNRTLLNMLVNGSFETWTAGTAASATTIPDGWGFTGNGAFLERYTWPTSGRGEGKYGVRVIKHATDTGVARLYQDVTPIVKNRIQSEYFTVSAMIRTDAGNKVRIYFQDSGSAPVEYSSYATADYDVVSLTRSMSASADKLIVGIECATHTSDYYAYVDSMVLVRGQIDPGFVWHPCDRAPACMYWDDDGSYVHLGGGVRIEPFMISSTLPASPSNPTVLTHTLMHGCNKILYASAEAVSFGTTNSYDVLTTCSGYGTGGGETQFNINLKNTTGAFTGSETYEVRGFAVVAGWDNYAEVHGE